MNIIQTLVRLLGYAYEREARKEDAASTKCAAGSCSAADRAVELANAADAAAQESLDLASAAIDHSDKAKALRAKSSEVVNFLEVK